MMSNTNVDLKLDTLKDLQTLWGIRGGDWMLKDMATMSCNLTKLRIQGISSQEQLEAVFNYPAIKNLYALVLDWYGFSSIECINKLCSNELQIQKLRLLGRAPDEKTPLRFHLTLGKLELYYTYLEKEETMDALGMLPHLKFLGLAKDSFVGCKWTCKENTFTSLEELNLSNLPKLENWLIEKETMPSLKNLSIISCEKLQRLPDNLKSLKELETLNIRRMPTSFNSRLKQKQGSNDTSQGGEDFEIVQHIPKFTVLDSCASFSI
ncbi:putative disease resistance RPP8-like protein 4 [Bienertia sinuspersici]